MSRPSAEQVLAEAGIAAADTLRVLAATLKPPFPGRQLPQAVVDAGLAPRDAVLAALGRAWELEPLPAAAAVLDPAWKGLAYPFGGVLPFDFCRSHCLAPLAAGGGKVVLACAEPPDPFVLESVHVITGLEPEPRLALAGEILRLCDAVDPALRRSGPIDRTPQTRRPD